MALLLRLYHGRWINFLATLSINLVGASVWTLKNRQMEQSAREPVTGTTIPWKGKKGQKGISVYFYRMWRMSISTRSNPLQMGVTRCLKSVGLRALFHSSPRFASQDDTFLCSWVQAVHSMTIPLHLRTSNSSNLNQSSKVHDAFTSCLAPRGLIQNQYLKAVWE